MIHDLMQYIKENQKGDGFKEWSFDDLLKWMSKAVDDRTLYWSVDENNKLNGVVLGILSEDKTKIFVAGILTTGKSVLKNFVNHLNKFYPNASLWANRKRKIVHYNTPKLKQKILAYGRT